MARKDHIVSATAEEIAARLVRGESRTDWAASDAMGQAEVERLADEEEGALPDGWEKTVVIGLPPGKDAISCGSTGTCSTGFGNPARATRRA